MADLCRISGSATAPEDVIAALERDGGVVIENFLAPATLAGLRDDLMPQLQGQVIGRSGFYGLQTRRLGALFAHTRHCAEIVTNPLFLAAAEHFVCHAREAWIGDERHAYVTDLRIGVTQAIQIGPGQVAQPLHRDDVAFFWRHPTGGCEGRVQVICAVSDFTADNGGTMVIPGSHLWDDDRKPQRSESIPAEMTAGSALMFLGSTYHGGGANRTERDVRTAVTISLDASYVRQEENMYLSLSPAVVASYPETIQRLLGWSSGSNFMGHVDVDGRISDPICLLRNLGGARPEAVGARRR